LVAEAEAAATGAMEKEPVAAEEKDDDDDDSALDVFASA
jgi:hypothetical protein